MQDRNNRSDIHLKSEEDSEGKAAQDSSPNGLGYEWELAGPCLDTGKGTAQIFQELIPQACVFALVPNGGFECVDFGFRPDLEAGRLALSTETGLQSLDDSVSWLGLVRGSAIGGEAFLQDALMPLMKRYLIHAGGNVVPERLHILDLIFDRKIVESRGRQWHWIPHYWRLYHRHRSGR